MIIDDKSKDADIDKVTDNIEFNKQALLENWTWLSEEKRREKKERIKMMEGVREVLVNKKIGKTVHRMKSLYDPIPLSKSEIEELYALIDSV
jgi:uncharacterized protein (DUF2344 family)